MKRKTPSTFSCTFARALEAIGDGWSWLIIRNLFHGQSRFAVLQDDLGIARNILSNRLKQLVGAGIVGKVADRQGSKYPEYLLTEKGQELLTVMVALNQWGDRHYTPTKGLASWTIDRATGEPLAPVALQNNLGENVPVERLRHVTVGEVRDHGWPHPENQDAALQE
ncbi:winged helix-turn-helix transcriptional regulator [Parendozoicomonas haliclonae]|uniref:Putative HTH-type transcriptional regulator YtcD n=1 Tax=Parendozoicomonas haliclonae TaxID=1960125 RepID=A0A1X7AK66_9GAMM|nr:helix-turn-helix domain-containing protein [Parendozoicomonas haliclonae]SMA47594.1 putative HTH-type transcriptional regulator YtcD [Parendozoicomonas haliclonae]